MMWPTREIDVERLVAAYRAKSSAPPFTDFNAKPGASLQPAPSREPCPRCGVSGARGCKHQAPFDGAPPKRIVRLGPIGGGGSRI